MRSAHRARPELLPGSPAGDGERGPGPHALDELPDATSPLRLLAIVGPTGTGKSDLAFQLALRLDGEIVGCDAVQVYRGFDRATAKPPPEQRRRIPHHLIDAVGPERDFSMADYVRRAEALVGEIVARGRVPIVVGGTGLYLRGLLRGIVPAPPRDAELRRRLYRVAHRRGPASLHRWLGRLDPDSAGRLAPADTQRVVRAIELALVDSRTWSQRLRSEGSWASGRERVAALKIGLDADRRWLAERLERRVDRFFEAGLVAEVRHLLDAGLSPEANAWKAIGYREVLAAILAGRDPEGVREQVKRSTRRYAKRQRTWFRTEPDVVWLDAERGTPQLVEQVVALWRRPRP